MVTDETGIPRTPIALVPTVCAICNTIDHSTELFPANFDFSAFNANVFSARRLPDGVHYRMVRCKRCALVRSDPAATPDSLAHLYRQSTFDYGDEVENLRQTYGRYLDKIQRYTATKGTLLEIGCGNGFFLEEALKRGYSEVKGVEPGSATVENAAPHIRSQIVCDIMRPGLFDKESVDVICLFQVLDHLPDPAAVLRECAHVLRPGGLILCFNHNIDALSARLLRARSPIIDIEHTYLYSPKTIARLLTMQGFTMRQISGAYNTYTVHYLVRLLPFPAAIKRPLLAKLKQSVVGQKRLSVPLGNLYAVAQRTA